MDFLYPPVHTFGTAGFSPSPLITIVTLSDSSPPHIGETAGFVLSPIHKIAEFYTPPPDPH